MPKSTTPKSDEKHALYASWYKRHKHVTCTREEMYLAKCEECGSPFMFLMSEYAMWYDSNDNAMICRSGHVVWFHVNNREEK